MPRHLSLQNCTLHAAKDSKANPKSLPAAFIHSTILSHRKPFSSKPKPFSLHLAGLKEKENPSEALDTGQRCVAAFARSGDYDALQRVFEQLRALRLEPASHLEVRASEGYMDVYGIC